jgi:hypothetical protein
MSSINSTNSINSINSLALFMLLFRPGGSDMNVKALIGIAVLALSGCTQNLDSPHPPVAATVKTPEAPPLPVEPLPAPSPKNDAPVTVLGVYSNRAGDGEHAWGYTVELWKHEDKIVGMIFGTNDLMLDGNPPTGLLENVRYDPKTGRISFSAKLSLTWHSDNTGSHDLYLFDGILTPVQMKGVISVREETDCENCGENINVVLPRKREPIVEQEAFKNIEEWQGYFEFIVGRRGAAW